MSLFSIAGTRSSRMMARTAVVVAVLVLSLFAQSGVAQTALPDALTLFKNYPVTGDYVVAGVGMAGTGVNGLATGNITISNGSIPAGADIVAAYLYWQTVEKTTTPSSTNGFFRGYPIIGTVLQTPAGGDSTAPCWSSGGGTGSSGGATSLRVYRADVRPFLPLDTNIGPTFGKVIGTGTFSVTLPDSGSTGNTVPITLGAGLVVIYRVLSAPAVPLKYVVIYDGAWTMNNATPFMSQNIFGFYQSAGPTGSTVPGSLTHIVGNGQLNKTESLNFNGTQIASNPFTGTSGSDFDNQTFPVSVPSNQGVVNTQVLPVSSTFDCLNWGAVVFSTPVQDSDNDGLLDVWEDNQGYTDVKSGQWVALPGANKAVKDLFIELDYTHNLDLGAGSYKHSHLPKKEAVDKAGNDFLNAPVDCNTSTTPPTCKGVHVHFDLGSVYQGDQFVITYPVATPIGATAFPGAGGNPISESSLLCTESLCEFPGLPVIGWKGGYLAVKNASTLPNGLPGGNFEPGRNHSYHYLLMGHAVGKPRSFWSTFATGVNSNLIAKLQSITIDASGTTATVTIASPAGLLKPGDSVSPSDPASADVNLDRVAVTGAIVQPALNGTYQFSGVTIVGTDPTTNVTTTKFTIGPVSAGPAGTTYNFSNEPQLGVAYGGPTSSSGHSDVGGGDSLISFGLWPADDPPNCQPDPSQTLNAGQLYCLNQVGTLPAQMGTIMHELGHSLALTHGGAYFGASNSPTNTCTVSGGILTGCSLPSYGQNCKSNFESAMNYLFQIRGFPDGAIDYSGLPLADLNEGSLDETLGLGAIAAAHPTRWFAPASQFAITNNIGLVSKRCDGADAGAEKMVRVDGPTDPTKYTTPFSSPLDWNNDGATDPVASPGLDINFNGGIDANPMHGYSDWAGFDLRQMGARKGIRASSAGGIVDLGGGIVDLGGGIVDLGGGIVDLGGGIVDLGGGIVDLGGGIIDLGGGIEVDFETASSSLDAPTNLAATFNLSTKIVTLTWTAPVCCGNITAYNIWRSDPNHPLALLKTVTGTNGAPPPTTTTDGPTGLTNHTTYTYFVTAVNASGVQSGFSNPAVVSVSWGYQFIGFLSPMTTAGDTSYSGAFTQGKAIPVKWQLKDLVTGQFVINLNANTLGSKYLGPTPSTGVCPLPKNVPLGFDLPPLYSPTTGAKGNSTFRYDTTNNQYIFNWDTKVNKKGCYILELDLDDGQVQRTALMMQ